MTRATRSETLSRKIADLISARGLEPGAPMPTEIELMQQLGVSRNSVRESIRSLQALGIVEIRHGYGTFVGSATSSVLEPWLLFRTRIGGAADRGRLAELLELREMIETELTIRAATDGDPALVAALGECVGRMCGPDGKAGAPDDPAVVDADRDFHARLASAAGIALASELIELFWTVYWQTVGELRSPQPHSNPVQIHGAIVDAIAAGDPDAAKVAVRQHFHDVRERIGVGAYGGPLTLSADPQVNGRTATTAG